MFKGLKRFITVSTLMATMIVSTIANADSSIESKVKVFSPNSGVKYHQGQSIPIRYYTSENNIALALVSDEAILLEDLYPAEAIVGWFEYMQGGQVMGQKAFKWKANQVCQNLPLFEDCEIIKPGNYRVLAVSKDEDGNLAWDFSDEPFTLTKGDFLFSVKLVSHPKASNGSEALDGNIRLKVGDKINFKRITTDSNLVINNAWVWQFDGTKLSCGAFPFDSPVLSCEVIATGLSPVSITMFPEGADGSSKIVTSNIIWVDVK